MGKPQVRYWIFSRLSDCRTHYLEGIRHLFRQYSSSNSAPAGWGHIGPVKHDCCRKMLSAGHTRHIWVGSHYLGGTSAPFHLSTKHVLENAFGWQTRHIWVRSHYLGDTTALFHLSTKHTLENAFGWQTRHIWVGSHYLGDTTALFHLSTKHALENAFGWQTRHIWVRSHYLGNT